MICFCKRLIPVIPACLIICIQMMDPAYAYNGKLLNGKAVSVQFRYGPWGLCEGDGSPWRGSLVVYAIQNSKVTRADTIYKKEQGFAHYAAFNLAGTKVAFYRFGTAPAAGGTGCVSVNGGKSYISIINSDGTGLRDLCELPAAPAKCENFPLDWPAGDWIYYTRPLDAALATGGSNSSTSIWRVNSVTGATEVACNLTDNGTGNVELCNVMRRFSLSVKGDRMAVQYGSGGKPGCTADPVNNNENCVHAFPPANCAMLSTRITCAAGCNASISPSGKILGSYFAGNHDALFLGPIESGPGAPFAGIAFLLVPNQMVPLNVLAALSGNLTKWAGEFVGFGAELIRWSANSDKWVMQKIGMTATGHAGNNNLGSNQVVCNFVDSICINISKNPRPPSTIPTNYVYWNNDAGDLWVSDPGLNPNGDRWEDIQGSWHTADGALAGAHIAVTPKQISAAVEKDSGSVTKSLQVSNTGSGTLNTVATSIQYGPGASGWLSAIVSGAGNNQQITLQFSQTSLPANTYRATLIVFEPGSGDTAWVPVSYSIQVARNPDNPANVQPGVFYNYYEGAYLPIPDFSKLTPVKTGVSAKIDLSQVPSGRSEQFAFRFDGYVDAPVQGLYTFTAEADCMANLYIGSELIYSIGRGDGHADIHTVLFADKGPIALKAGKHSIRVDYIYPCNVYDQVLNVNWECQKAGIARQLIPANRLYNTNGMVIAFAPVNKILPSQTVATMILYNLQGKRVGTQTNGMMGKRSRYPGLLIAVTEKQSDRTSKTIVIAR